MSQMQQVLLSSLLHYSNSIVNDLFIVIIIITIIELGCCLLKIATLYSGVQTLVSHGVHSLLIDLICNGNLDLVMKTQCMATLLQVCSPLFFSFFLQY